MDIKFGETFEKKRLAAVILAIMLMITILSGGFEKAKADTAQTLPNHIIINQVYGAGPAPDNSVPVSNSFIELYNPTSSNVDLTGYTLWYRHGNNYTNAAYTDKTAVPVDENWYKLDLTGTIASNGSYLIKGASALKIESCDPVDPTHGTVKAPDSKGFNADGTATTVHLYFKDSDIDTAANSGQNKTWNDAYAADNIPTVTADQNWSVRLANKGVEVLLLDPSGKNSYTAGTTTGTAPTSTMPVNPYNIDGKGKKATGYVDMLGVAGNDSYDGSIDGYESSFTSVQSKQKSLRRIAFQDTDNNAADFEIEPYNAAYIVPWAKPRSTADGQWKVSEKPVQPDDTAFGSTVPTENPAIYPSKFSGADAQPIDTSSALTITAAITAQYNTKATAPYCLTNTFTADPTNTRTFTWDAPASVKNGEVQISTSNGTITSTKNGKVYNNIIDYSSFKVGIVSNVSAMVDTDKIYDAPLNGIGVNDLSIFRAAASGLQPGTTYYYRVGNDTDGWSPIYTFTTEATSIANGTSSFTFLHVSDTQATNLGDYQVWQKALDNYTPSLSQPISFFLHTGDECDGTNREDEWRGFFGTPVFDINGIASKDYRYHFGNNAFMPVVGNHEQAGPTDTGNAAAFTEHFTVPNNGPSDASVTPGTVYSFDYGTAHFDVINSQTDLNAEAAWLAKDLASTTKKWKIVALHRGLYESSGQDDTLISTFGSILDKYGVDLILQGHDHVYVKTKAMRNGQVDPNGIGTISVETGSSGAKQDSAGGLMNYEDINVTNGAPAFSAITVTNDSISLDTKKVVTNADSSVTLTAINSFSITKPEAQKLAEVVTAQIAALPASITLANSNDVSAARLAYNALSEAEQALVTDYTILTAAEKTIADINQAAAAKAADQASANQVIAKVSAIPSAVTLTDAKAITDARTAYNALTASQKALVTNYSTLTAAEKTIADLNQAAAAKAADQVAASQVIAKVNVIPSAVTLTDVKAITDARTSYNALTASEKTIADLNQAAAAKAADQAAANQVIAKISAIPSAVTLADAKTITDARTAYDALAEVQKLLITNYSFLTAAEGAIANIRAIPDKIANASDSASVLSVINNAIAYNVQVPIIDITNTPIVSKDLFNVIKGKDKAVTFTGSNVSWTFNGKDITSAVAGDIDLSLKTVSDDLKNKETAKIKALIGENVPMISFSFNYEGQLPGVASVRVFISKDWANRIVNIYRYYPDKNTYNTIQSNITVDADGYITYTTNHCSDYFVMDAKSVTNLPKTGSAVDSSVIIYIGLVSVIFGAAYILYDKRRKRKIKEA